MGEYRHADTHTFTSHSPAPHTLIQTFIHSVSLPNSNHNHNITKHYLTYWTHHHIILLMQSTCNLLIISDIFSLKLPDTEISTMQSTGNDRVDPHRGMTSEREPKALLSSVHTDGPIVKQKRIKLLSWRWCPS